jgi:hypothetical protein
MSTTTIALKHQLSSKSIHLLLLKASKLRGGERTMMRISDNACSLASDLEEMRDQLDDQLTDTTASLLKDLPDPVAKHVKARFYLILDQLSDLASDMEWLEFEGDEISRAM